MSNISVIGGTTNLSVTWTRASGMVWSYSVFLNGDLKQVNKDGDLTALVRDLTPGVVYCVVVVSHVDSLNTSSPEVCNATRESRHCVCALLS